MVFEVRATHQVAPSGNWACEVHPDVFVDETGEVFSTTEGASGKAAKKSLAAVATVTGEDVGVFVVEDNTVELAADWIEMLGGSREARERIEQRRRRRWPFPAGSVADVPAGLNGPSRLREKRVVEFEVRASHHLSGGRELACELYPHVFAGQRGGAISRYAGMAMQQSGDIAAALPPGTQKWFRVRGLQQAAGWVATVANIGDQFWLEQHGRKASFFSVPPVGPMGPAAPARQRLSC